MATAKQQVQAAAINAAERCLKLAAAYAHAHIGGPLFKKLMRRRGGPSVLVRLMWPGVLQVLDPTTGELLGESLPGEPWQLSGAFVDRILNGAE